MPTTITGQKVDTDETTTTTLSGTLTNEQLVQGALDGDLALDGSGNIVLQNRGSFAHTDAEETITARWKFNRPVDMAGNLNMVSDTGGTVVGLSDPENPGHAVPLRYLEQKSLVKRNGQNTYTYTVPLTFTTNNPAAGGDNMLRLLNQSGTELLNVSNTNGDFRTSNTTLRLGWSPDAKAPTGTAYTFGAAGNAEMRYASDGGIIAQDDNGNTSRII